LEREVPPLLQRAQHLWVCSREDRAFVPADNVSILPNIPFVAEGGEAPGTPAPPPEEPRLLMVGALKYVVNERGVDRFLSATWPAVRAAHPRARFRIVGSGMSGLQRARWRRSAGVEPVGFVEDLAREYAQASFTVVPLFEGGGTKIKALESLLHGRACVVTSHVERGFAPFLVHGESLWVAKDEHAFAEGCIELLGDRTRCDALATRGREQVLKHFSFPAFAEIVRNTLERLSARFPGGVQVQGKASDAVPNARRLSITPERRSGPSAGSGGQRQVRRRGSADLRNGQPCLAYPDTRRLGGQRIERRSVVTGVDLLETGFDEHPGQRRGRR
jgi:hypothetical protein